MLNKKAYNEMEDIMWKYYDDDYSEHMEARFWNQGDKQMAIVAMVTKDVDWAAYIGTDAPNSWSEIDTCKYVERYGRKLSEYDASHFFPDISLRYRH